MQFQSPLIYLITLIWVLLERSFSPAEHEYNMMPISIKGDDVRNGTKVNLGGFTDHGII